MADYLVQVAAGVTVLLVTAVVSAVLGGQKGRSISAGRTIDSGGVSQSANVSQVGSGNTSINIQQVINQHNAAIRSTPGPATAKSNDDQIAEMIALGLVGVIVFVLIVGLLPVLLFVMYLLAVATLAAGSYLVSATRLEGPANRSSRYTSSAILLSSIIAGVLALAALPYRRFVGDPASMSLVEISERVGFPQGFSGQGLSVTIERVGDYFLQSWNLLWSTDPGFIAYIVFVMIVAFVQLVGSWGLVADWMAYVRVSARQAHGLNPPAGSKSARRAARFLDNERGGQVAASLVVLLIVLGAAFGLWEKLFAVVAAWAMR